MMSATEQYAPLTQPAATPTTPSPSDDPTDDYLTTLTPAAVPTGNATAMPATGSQSTEPSTIALNATPVIETTTVASGSLPAADDTTTGYTPTFGAATRTVVYVACAVIGLFGLLAAIASVATGAPAWLTIASSALSFTAPYIANMFGVAYNPLKMSGKQ
jgi:hypothetical protein